MPQSVRQRLALQDVRRLSPVVDARLLASDRRPDVLLRPEARAILPGPRLDGARGMISWLIVAILAASCAVSGFGSGWLTKGWKDGAERATELAQMEKARDVALAQRDEKQQAMDKQALDFDQRLATLRPRYTTIRNEVQHEHTKETIYAACVVPDAGVQLLQRAYIEAHRSAGYGDPVDIPAAVPAAPAAAAGKGDDGRPAR